MEAGADSFRISIHFVVFRLINLLQKEGTHQAERVDKACNPSPTLVLVCPSAKLSFQVFYQVVKVVGSKFVVRISTF